MGTVFSALHIMYVRVHPDRVMFPCDYTSRHQGVEIKLHGTQIPTPELSRSGRFTPGEMAAVSVYDTILTLLGDLHI
jgi:hypothetical protein